MSTYVIGDIQGCLHELKELLNKISFSSDKDQIWFTGDLVNRGPDSLGVLRFVKSLEENAITVLGNHDLHMLAIVHGLEKQRPSDTFDEIINAKDKNELMQWISTLPLLHTANNDQHILVHAGLYPQWTIPQAKQYAHEVETILQSDQLLVFLSHMYGNKPDAWEDSIEYWDRLRFITNCFTRMRYCTVDGRLNLRSSVAPGKQESGLVPWYTLKNNRPTSVNLFFGHWSTLGLLHNNGIHCLDTGCLWGGTLTAMKIDDDSFECTVISCPCE